MERNCVLLLFHLKAKGLLTLMLSLLDDWKFNIRVLCLLCKESMLTITNAFKELKENNYLEIEKGYDYNGKFLYQNYYKNLISLFEMLPFKDKKNILVELS